MGQVIFAYSLFLKDFLFPERPLAETLENYYGTIDNHSVTLKKSAKTSSGTSRLDTYYNITCTWPLELYCSQHTNSNFELKYTPDVGFQNPII